MQNAFAAGVFFGVFFAQIKYTDNQMDGKVVKTQCFCAELWWRTSKKKKRENKL